MTELRWDSFSDDGGSRLPDLESRILLLPEERDLRPTLLYPILVHDILRMLVFERLTD